MIVVIADDFSGAAEIGAVGWRHGLKTVVTTEFVFDPEAELVVIDTNTRSAAEPEARARLAELTGPLLQAAPAWVYKKVDSVLRGHVVAELQILLEGPQWTRALVVPANPTLGRTMRGGCYYIDGVPLHHTSFAVDAEYPARTSNVRDLLRDGHRAAVASAGRIGSAVPEQHMVVGDATSVEDLVRWAGTVREDVLPAGGADFFAALLAARGYRPSSNGSNGDGLNRYGSRSGFYLIGSRTPQSMQSMRRLHDIGFAIDSVGVRENGTSGERMVERVGARLRERFRVILTTANDGASSNSGAVDPAWLAHIATQVLSQVTVQEVIAEGGSTASLLVRALGWQRFVPVDEIGRGIVRMAVGEQEDVHLTVKPGSYLWPDESGA